MRTGPGRPALTAEDHSRDSAGLKYVYPVVSRRAGGVSIGINLNTNNACNWACVYCQVPGLLRKRPEAVDLARLDREFRDFLSEVLDGEFMSKHVPVEARRVADVAFSGNGEPTLSPQFAQAVEIVSAGLREHDPSLTIPIRLITNGSLIARPTVQRGVRLIGAADGEVWFKLDRASRAGMAQVNQVWIEPAHTLERLRLCCGLAPTWLQTCWFGIDGEPPSAVDVSDYLNMLMGVRDDIRGVLLYGMARRSMQAAAGRLQRLPAESLRRFAAQIEALGVEVRVSP